MRHHHETLVYNVSLILAKPDKIYTFIVSGCVYLQPTASAFIIALQWQPHLRFTDNLGVARQFPEDTPSNLYNE